MSSEKDHSMSRRSVSDRVTVTRSIGNLFGAMDRRSKLSGQVLNARDEYLVAKWVVGGPRADDIETV